MKKNKILFLVISILIVIVTSLGVGIISSLDLNNETYTDDKFILNIDKNSDLVIKDKKIYCNNSNSYIEIINGDNIYDYYPIELYDFSSYYFIVFSNNQEFLIDDLFLDENNYYKRNSLLYIVDKDNGLAKNVFNFDVYNSYRYKLDTIKFMNDDLFYMEVYSVNYNDLIYISIFHIEELNDDIYLSRVFLNDKFNNPSYSLVGFEINKYALIDDLYLIYHYDENRKVSTLFIYEYELSFNYEKDADGIVSSYSVNSNSIKDKYINEKYLNEGYFINKNNKIYYLSNNLIIKEINIDDHDLEIKELNSIEEWEDFINN